MAIRELHVGRIALLWGAAAALNVYAHALPSMQKDAAAKIASLLM